MKETAYFVNRSRILENLKAPHFAETEEPYEIIKEVTLSKIDYENFVTDMLADRKFLDGYDVVGASPKQCILIQQRGEQTAGVLVVPTTDGHVQSAAFVAAK